MPIHDWTRVSAGGYHTFHQDWVIEINRTLNRGVLPEGYSAYNDLRVIGREPDVVAIQNYGGLNSGGVAVREARPIVRQMAKVESDAAIYARKANQIVIREEFGTVVAIIEVVSPGNKDSLRAFREFREKAVEFLRRGVNLIVIDLFPPSPRDPDGIHHAIWNELTDEPFEARPADKPLTVASYDAGDDLTAYVDPVAIGDALPNAPLFLGPGWYVYVPLEKTYAASWDVCPKPLRERVAD